MSALDIIRRCASSQHAAVTNCGESGSDVLDENGVSFRPIFNFSLWRDRTSLKRLSYAINLPSGCGKGMFRVSVKEDGTVLELEVTWPSLSKPPFKCPRHAPKMGQVRRHLSAHVSDSITSCCQIILPIQVQMQPDTVHLLGDANGTRVVYVELKAHVDDYMAPKQSGSFEII